MSNHNLPERDRAPLTRRTTTNDAAAADVGATPHPMLALQRQLGNAHIARMLAQRDEMPEEEDEQLQAKHDPAIAQRESEMPEEEDEQLQAKHDPAIAQRHGSEDELQASPEVGHHSTAALAQKPLPREATSSWGKGQAQATRA
jgi:hypothetical protein